MSVENQSTERKKRKLQKGSRRIIASENQDVKWKKKEFYIKS